MQHTRLTLLPRGCLYVAHTLWFERVFRSGSNGARFFAAAKIALAPCFGSQNDSALSALNDGACFVFSISLSGLILFV
jgi:hypothetical protein